MGEEKVFVWTIVRSFLSPLFKATHTQGPSKQQRPAEVRSNSLTQWLERSKAGSQGLVHSDQTLKIWLSLFRKKREKNFSKFNKKIGPILKSAFIKKSTIFARSLWNLVKMTSWRVQYFDQVSYKLGKNCGFFDKRTFFIESGLPFFRV